MIENLTINLLLKHLKVEMYNFQQDKSYNHQLKRRDDANVLGVVLFNVSDITLVLSSFLLSSLINPFLSSLGDCMLSSLCTNLAKVTMWVLWNNSSDRRADLTWSCIEDEGITRKCCSSSIIGLTILLYFSWCIL